MTQQELRVECVRLFNSDTLKDCQDLIDILLEYLFSIIINHSSEAVITEAERDARIVNQMLFTKIASLKELSAGFEFTAKNGAKLNRVVDPTVIAVLIRNIYETTAMFNLINVHPKNDDQRTIMYNLWAISGLKYRQGFCDYARSAESIEKMQDEADKISLYTQQIQLTSLFKNLSTNDQEKILNKIKAKDYKIQFVKNNIDYLSWQEVTKVMGLRAVVSDKMYAYFSLYAHPSNVSVFQFANLFKAESPYFEEMTMHNIRYVFYLVASFITDYIKVFPTAKNTFNKLPLVNQIVLNWLIAFTKGKEHVINNTLHQLG